MKIKILLLVATCIFDCVAFAQQEIMNRLSNIDWDEDSTKVITVSEIFDTQQSIASIRSKQKHLDEVWSNRKFLNISYNSTKMDSKQKVNIGSGPVNLDYESKWGIGITRGKNFLLYKKPISNYLSFYLDYVGFDFNINYYDYANKNRLFDLNSSFSYTDNSETKQGYYTPWDFEKYELDYGMRFGPSVTIAPFIGQDNKMLHFVKFNFYWHIGYNVSLAYIAKDETKSHYIAYDAKRDGVKSHFNLGHDIYNVLGFNVSWNKIGIGFEARNGNYNYYPIFDDNFGTKDGLKETKNEYKFKTTSSRIFIQFRW